MLVVIHGGAAGFMAHTALTDPRTVSLVDHLPLERFEDRTHHIGSIQLEWLSAIMLGLASLHHVTVARRGSKYWTGNDNVFILQQIRWIEYSLSASVMHVQLGILSGITDIHLLWLVAILIGLTMLSALATDYLINLLPRTTDGSTELQRLVRNSCQPLPLHQKLFYCGWAMGWLCFVAAWSVIACYFCFSATHGTPPVFVWVIMGVILVLDVSFAYVYRQQHKFDQPCGLLWIKQYEMHFAGLSLVSKQSLAWILYFGSRAIE
jgi:hypothetical protein